MYKVIFIIILFFLFSCDSSTNNTDGENGGLIVNIEGDYAPIIQHKSISVNDINESITAEFEVNAGRIYEVDLSGEGFGIESINLIPSEGDTLKKEHIYNADINGTLIVLVKLENLSSSSKNLNIILSEFFLS